MQEGGGAGEEGRGTAHLLLYWSNVLRVQMRVRVEEGSPGTVALQGQDRPIGNICNRGRGQGRGQNDKGRGRMKGRGGEGRGGEGWGGVGWGGRGVEGRGGEGRGGVAAVLKDHLPSGTVLS